MSCNNVCNCKRNTTKLKCTCSNNIYTSCYTSIPSVQCLPKLSSISYIKNRCLITGNTRSVFRRFRLSRWEIKKLGINVMVILV